MEWIKLQINKFTLWRLKRYAKRMHGITGKQYHVLPSTNNKLIVVDNSMIKEMNRKSKKKLRMKQVYEISLYSTPAVSPFKK